METTKCLFDKHDYVSLEDALTCDWCFEQEDMPVEKFCSCNRRYHAKCIAEKRVLDMLKVHEHLWICPTCNVAYDIGTTYRPRSEPRLWEICFLHAKALVFCVVSCVTLWATLISTLLILLQAFTWVFLPTHRESIITAMIQNAKHVLPDLLFYSSVFYYLVGFFLTSAWPFGCLNQAIGNDLLWKEHGWKLVSAYPANPRSLLCAPQSNERLA